MAQSLPAKDQTLLFLKPMITIFHVIQLVALICGVSVGFRVGLSNGGTLGALVGTTFGIVIGWVVGRLPLIIASNSLHRSLKRASSSELRMRFESEYFISHLIIAELYRRGESIQSLESVVVAQLHSESPDVQKFGRANAAAWFPDLVRSTDQH